MTQSTDVAIIGAGPYGLSLAAHLRARGVNFRIFGDSMRFWRDMPVGVNLKSLAFATNIYVPQRGHTFPQWCREHGIEDFEPCTMQSFAAYGCEMQQRFVPEVEPVFVTDVGVREHGFALTLASGEHFTARRVVSCTGLSGLAHIPEALRHLPRERMRHTFDISDYGEFRNKTVAVIGAGASAIEAGALVRESGGSSDVFARTSQIVIHGRAPRHRPLWQRLKAPDSVLGASRGGWILQHFPLRVFRMPLEERTRYVKNQFGPASPWWIKDRVEGVVPIHLRHELIEATTAGDQVLLRFKDGAQNDVRTVKADFVIAGTGYDTDVSRLSYLGPDIAGRIKRIERAPELNIHFESSVPGLYFLGANSFMCFGPLFRFVSGAGVAAPRLARRLG